MTKATSDTDTALMGRFHVTNFPTLLSFKHSSAAEVKFTERLSPEAVKAFVKSVALGDPK